MSNQKIPLLLDLDGVLRIGNSPAPGIDGFLNYLVNSNFTVCILSNSSLSTGSDIQDFFRGHSVNCPFPIITAIDTAIEYVKINYTKVDVLVSENLKSLFGDYLEKEHPEAVVVGDIGDAWNYKLLNDIFLKIINGADLIAIHKNKFWMAPKQGLMLDAGPFISALEYAASKKAIVIGKPSEVYFRTALEKTGSTRFDNVIMIGDDPETDIRGIQTVGGKGLLVFSGKTKYPYKVESEIKPDFEAMNLYEAEEILREIENEDLFGH